MAAPGQAAAAADLARIARQLQAVVDELMALATGTPPASTGAPAVLPPAHLSRPTELPTVSLAMPLTMLPGSGPPPPVPPPIASGPIASPAPVSPPTVVPARSRHRARASIALPLGAALCSLITLLAAGVFVWSLL